jgi:hypothetical protein
MFAHDFEADLQGPFTGIFLMTGDTVSWATSVPHQGLRSARCQTNSQSNNQASPYLEFTMRDQIYVSEWIRTASGFPAGNTAELIAVSNNMTGTWRNIATVDLFPDMRVGVFNEALDTWTYSSATIGSGWHRVELWLVASPTAGRIALAIDGAIQFDLTGIDTGALLFHLVLTCITWQGTTNEPLELYMDDVVID